MDLVEFLRARYADDERAATTLDELGGWERSGIEATAGGHVLDYLDHFNPQRMLADVAAKREILDWCADVLSPHKEYQVVVADGVIRRMALPYTGHPDYDPAWRPE